MVLASVLVFIAFVYAGIMAAYLRAWQMMPEWHLPDDFEPGIKTTVVVAARNEAANIKACLFSIMNGRYPPELLEIMVVDDFSEDDTAGLVREVMSDSVQPWIRLLQLSDVLPPEHRHSPNKKKAIELAVAQAQGSIIVTTDADCFVPADWLRLVASRFAADPDLAILAAPVMFHHEKNLLQRFQSLDFLGMMGVTAGGLQLGWHHMGNGANLAYRKTSFEVVGGFAGNGQVASGDDMFLLQKIAAQWPGSVGFLKNPGATVRTEAKATWREFWQQRLRWGTKNAALPEWRIKVILLVVWLFCWSILLGPFFAMAGYLPWQTIVFQVIIKAIADWFLLNDMCRYFNRKDLMPTFLFSFLMHTSYIAIVGLVSLFFKKYEWKGRTIVE